MTRRAPYVSIGLAVLSLCVFAIGWLLSFEPGLRAFRLVGFALGGMVSVPTLVLCLYYQRHGVRGAGLRTAMGISALYTVLFALVAAALFSRHPVASEWIMYAF
jgi:hypothetical protein